MNKENYRQNDISAWRNYGEKMGYFDYFREETKRQYKCSICGYSPLNRSNWCAMGCGRDYNEMIEINRIINNL